MESVLRGDWLGHAFHPLMTDLSLGCWLGAGLLDLFGGKPARRSAQFLVGCGLLAAIPTGASGAAEWRTVGDRASRRIAVVHATGNAVVILLYFRSWLSRHAGKHLAGIFSGMAGASLAWATGYLGGHMSLALGVGTGVRSRNPDGTLRDTATN